MQVIFLLLSLFPTLALTAPTSTKPKYGPRIVTLSQSHEYLAKHAAPDYWVLAPYYLPQLAGNTCSLAAETMAVNAARAASGARLGAEDKLATQNEVLDKSGAENWQKRLRAGKSGFSGLEELAVITEAVFKSYQLKVKSVRVIRASEAGGTTASAVHEALVANEKSAKDFLIANFDQGVITEDTHVGHVAPVAAYDSAKKRVLIFDPDREWYEPYWVPEEIFVKSLATLDTEAGKNRGLIWVKLGD